MKDKFWEAKIPGSERNWLVDAVNNPQGIIDSKEQFESDSKSVILIFDFSSAILERKRVIKWIRKNKIPLCNWQSGTLDDDHQWPHIFRFKTEEDAMAFKIMWS